MKQTELEKARARRERAFDKYLRAEDKETEAQRKIRHIETAKINAQDEWRKACGVVEYLESKEKKEKA